MVAKCPDCKMTAYMQLNRKAYFVRNHTDYTYRAKKCFRMLRNVSFCCVHTCAPARGAEHVMALPTAIAVLYKVRFVNPVDPRSTQNIR